jgi:uncharacterized protein
VQHVEQLFRVNRHASRYGALARGVPWCMFSDPGDSSVYYLLDKMVNALVDRTEAVRITTTPQPEGACFSILVHREDIGKLIGKQGRTARSLRILVSGIGVKMHRRYTVGIEE